ncbi:MAG: hypothetical protein LBK06_08840 [Planctomycetaceae bacterium]|jgi:hypothetical protein|nr:hypothetical protein [Planctomycetaceae bacterium]
MSRALDGEEKWSLMPIKHHLIKTLRRKFRNGDADDDDGDEVIIFDTTLISSLFVNGLINQILKHFFNR